MILKMIIKTFPWPLRLIAAGLVAVSVLSSQAQAGATHMSPPDYLLGPTYELTGRSFLLAQAANNPQKTQTKKGTFILVRSAASGAHVLLDDIRVGEVNRLIRVAPGIRKITVVHSDYQPKTLEVRLTRGKRQVIRIQLTKKDSMAPVGSTTPPAGTQAQAGAPPAAGYSMQPGYPLPGQAPPAQPYVIPPVTVVQPPAGYYGATQPGVAPAPPPRRRRKKRRKRRKKPEAKESVSSIAQAPPVKPRGAGDYMLSLLPLGIPQMNHKKPALGILFLLVQGGGVGTYFAWNPLIINPMIEDRKQTLKRLRNDTAASTTTNKKRINDYEKSYKQRIERWQQWEPAPLIAAGVFYGISVLEAMFVGPPVPKSPLEKMLGSQNSPMGLALDHSPDPLFMKVIHNSDWNLGVVPVPSSLHLVFDWTLAL